MKQNYQGHLVAWAVVLCLIFMPVFQLHAQQVNGIQQKVFRVKFKENFVNRLEKSSRKKTAEGWVTTGHSPLDQLNKKYGISEMKRVFPQSGKWEQKHRKWGLHLWYELKVEEGSKTLMAVSSFSKLTEVIAAEAVYEKHTGVESPAARKAVAAGVLPGLPNDPQLSTQWHYHNTGQDGGLAGADIRLQEAWQTETGNPAVIVAVIDGGIDINHSDLAPNMWRNTGEIPGNGIDDDSNGYIDDIHGYNFGDGNSNIPADFHGTHVGGTVAAVTNNGDGVAGVAGGSGAGDGARLMSLSAFGEFGVGGFEQAFVYAADNGAVIAQNSWGYIYPDVYEQSVLDAIDYFIAEAGYDHHGNPRGPMQGGIVIFAAGNSGSDAKWYPGYYEPVFAVAATDRWDNAADFSNRGSWVELSAPGVDVYSTFPDNSYGSISGTSMACPHVSGVAALVVSRFAGSISPEQLKQHLMAGTDPISSLPPGFGAGRLNASNALQENDEQPPFAVTDLVVTGAIPGGLQLSWTAPADPGNGKASSYQIRYATAPITEANFSMATPVSNTPPAAAAGTQQTFNVIGLQSSTTFYIALKAVDAFGNISGISNIVSGTPLDAPILNITPSHLDAEINVSSSLTTTRTLTITNTGPEGTLLDFSIFSYFHENAVSFSPASGSVAAGASAEIEVIFSASFLQNGDYVFNLGINSNDPARESVLIPASLNINGQGPRMGVEYQSLDFDTTFVGGSGGRVLYIRNLGTDLLYIHEISSSDPAFSPEISNMEIYPGEENILFVSFTPTEAGNKQATLSLSSNDPYRPLVEIPMSGIGAEPPRVRVSPENFSIEIDVVSNPSVTRTLTIANDGVSTLYFDLFSFWGEEVISFKPSSGSLAPGTSTEIETTFSAYGIANGHHYIDIEVYNNDPTNTYLSIPVTILVSGQTADLVIHESSIDFEGVFVGGSKSMPVYITNAGLDNLIIHEISSSDPAFSPATSSLLLPPYGGDLFYVNFSPTQTGSKQATLSFHSNDPDEPIVTITLLGNGVDPPVIAINPEQISTSLVLGESGTETFTISNTGNSPLTYSFPAFAVQSLLKDPSVRKNNTTPLALPAQYHKREKGSKEADPVGHPVVLGAGIDFGFGYTWIDSDAAGGPAFVWEDIAATGIEILPDTDDGEETVYLPFNFKFYGSLKNTITISTNGLLTFGDHGSWLNDPIPSSWEPNDMIAAFWDDLRPWDNTGHIYYRATPEALLVQYEAVGNFWGTGTATFQVKLLPDGTIYFYYKDVSTLEVSNSATIGIENEDASDGLQVVFNNDYVKNNLAVMITPPSGGFITDVSHPWGVIPAHSSQLVEASISTSGLDAGMHQHSLQIRSNDPINPSMAIPFELTVTESNPNNPPLVVGKIKKQNIKRGTTATLDLSRIFRDPDGDVLSFTAAATNPALAGMAMHGNTLQITGLLPGTTMINIVASDGRGGLAGTSFELKVTGGKKDNGKGAKTAAASDPEVEIISWNEVVNYPNPFRGETTISYSLKQDSYVKLQVFSVLGKPLTVMVDGVQQAGQHNITFDASLLPAGIYLYRIQVADTITTKRMVVK
jgi:subtilisin family serine protease